MGSPFLVGSLCVGFAHVIFIGVLPIVGATIGLPYI